MDDRGYKPKSFGFASTVKPNSSRRVHPYDEDNEDISPASFESNPSPNTQAQSSARLIQRQINVPKPREVPFKTKTGPILSSASITGLLITGGILLGICSVVVISSALGVILSRSPSMLNGTSTSTVAPTVRIVNWNFDNNANDLYGVYNGVLLNGASYSSSTYFGTGANLALNGSLNQSVIISSPFLNLSYTGFTVEAWIYGSSYTGDNAILGQCQCNSCQDQCLYLLIRNSKMYMGFLLDDVLGTTSLSLNTWYHVAYVYDYNALTQYLYLQGVLDSSSPSSGPYLGQNGSTLIGFSYLSSSQFNGYIDNLVVTTRAKSANEILYDASVVVYFSFDGATLGQDMGPNQMNGTVSNAAAVSGKIGQGLAFSGAVSSYLQIYGFYQLGQPNKAFSFTMWLYPYSVTGGSLIQNSQYSNSSGWCYHMMGFTYIGQIVNVIYTSYTPTISGPELPVRSWTHIGYTYSQTNGARMYINGVFFGSTGPVSWSSSGAIQWLSIGSYVVNACGSGGVVYTVPYLGVIDEFYVYRRELNATELSVLGSS